MEIYPGYLGLRMDPMVFQFTRAQARKLPPVSSTDARTDFSATRTGLPGNRNSMYT
jgi:hypothetical protein